MRRLTVDPRAPEADALDEAAATLRAGGLVAYPTETYYGLAVDVRSGQAVEALFAAKGREREKAIPLVASGLDQLEALGIALTPAARRLAREFWPGPLTLVIPAWPGLAPAVCGQARTAGVRVPGHPVARGLAAAFGYPVASTSANRSGEPPLADPVGVERAVGASIDLLLDGGPAPGGLASTIVDVSGPVPRLVRLGPIAWEQVLECLR